MTSETGNQGSQIAQIFASLAKHSDLLSMALDGPVETGNREQNKAIDALVMVNALKPYEEGTYRLNPRLRDFISDHLISYNAFQALTRVKDRVHQAQAQWSQLQALRQAGATADADRLEWALDDTVTDIDYAIERNLTLLNSLVSTQYGNVTNLKAKLNQNLFYGREVDACMTEMNQVDSIVDLISAEALNAGILSVRQLINRRLGSKLLNWRVQLKDAQAIISKRLFWQRKMERRLNNLAKSVLWLNQHKTSSGIEIDVDTSAPIAIFKPVSIKVKPHLDVRDKDPVTWDEMVTSIAKLTKRIDRSLPAANAKAAQPVLAAEMAEIEIILTAEEFMLDQLTAELLDSDQTISLCEWKSDKPQLNLISDEEWLLYASGQLYAQGFFVRMAIDDEQDPCPINHRFYDFLVTCKTSSNRIS